MNKDQAKGAAKDVVGKVQEEAGKLVGSKEQEIMGPSKQTTGKAQKGLGDIKQAVEDSTKSWTKPLRGGVAYFYTNYSASSPANPEGVVLRYFVSNKPA